MYGDEEMEEVDMDFFVVDLDYEFDANRFFDFTWPESSSEAEVSESWFQSAATYPPSPFIVKFKWREQMYPENAKASLKLSASNAGESMISNSKASDCDIDPNVLDDNREGSKHPDEMVQNNPKTKVKSVGRSAIRISTLMKPTASHLAKIKPASETCSIRSIERSPSSLSGFSKTSSRSTFSVYLDATKRQKLDMGYLRKVARLKHQNLLLHKLSVVPRGVANTVNSRPKPTIPREPNLETARRAQRHRSRDNPETDVNSKLKPSSSKEQPVKGKINKSERQPTASQRRDNQISGSTSTVGITGTERPNHEAPEQKKLEPAKSSKFCSLGKQKLKHPAENGSSCSPPTELFKKMSLKSEVGRNTVSRSNQPSNKVPKENVPGSLRRDISIS